MGTTISAGNAYTFYKRFVRTMIPTGMAVSIRIKIMRTDISADRALMIFIITVIIIQADYSFRVPEEHAAVFTVFIHPTVTGDSMMIVVSFYGQAFSCAFVPECAIC